VWSTPPATSPSSPVGKRHTVRRALSCPKRWMMFVVVGFLTGLLAEASPVSADVDSDGVDSAVQAVSYSTGKSGSRLKWISQRPDSVKAKTSVVAAQYAAPAARSGRQPRLARSQNLKPLASPYNDPFGDQVTTPPPTPPEELSKELLEAMPAEPKPSDGLPGLAADEPADDEIPYLPSEDTSKKDNAKKSPKNDSTPPLLEQELVSRQYELNEKCPTPKDLKPIAELTTNIVPSAGDLPRDCPLGKYAKYKPRAFAPITYTWTASGLCHKPLYFEDVQLERYGHMCGPWLQPFASGAHFFLTVPILPYKMGLELPNECRYTLGYYRPGNCAPICSIRSH